MFSTAARARLSPAAFAIVLTVCLAVAPARAEITAASLFRVFLLDGESLVSYGEFARVADRVVLAVPLGDQPDTLKLQLVSVPENAVDWPRTEEYAYAVRARRYAETRGEDDFTLLAARVTSALNDIHLAPTAKRRVEMAEEARRNLAAWPAANYGYRAADVAKLVAMLDDVVVGMRRAAGETEFELTLVAMPPVPPVVDLLPPPDVRGSLEAAFRAAVAAADPGERIALLRALTEELAFAPKAEGWAPALRARASDALEAELRIEKQYGELSRASLRNAADRAARADVRGLQQIIARALAADERLGRKRPGEMTALLAELDLRLDEARRLEVARAAWAARVAVFKEYRRTTDGPRRRIDGFVGQLRQIRDRSGPSPRSLQRLEIHATMGLHELATADVPPELRRAHGLFVASLQLTREAASLRRNAVSSSNATLAWDASSAAAGAMLLAERAADELERLISDSTTTPR